MPYAYRKSERIRKNREFLAAMKGKRLSVDGLSLFYAPNDLGGVRVGISVGKKLGNAVTRNRLRRRLRACIGRVLTEHSFAYDLVFVARQGLADLDYEQLLKTVTAAFRKTALFAKPPSGNEQ